MAGRENNASSPINIQIYTDQQIALEKYIYEQETPREKHTKYKATQDIIEATLGDPCLETLTIT